MSRTYIGARLRRLRNDAGLQQAEMAAQLGISASYLNQIEHDQRPLTAPLLLKLTEAFGDRLIVLSESEQVRLAADLQQVALDLDGQLSPTDVIDLASTQPDLAGVMVALHRRYRDAADQLAALTESVGAEREVGARASHMPFELVRDFFYEHHNYFGEIDEAAEALGTRLHLPVGAMEQGLTEHLADAHRVTVVVDLDARRPELRRFDPDRRTVTLSGALTSGQRAYQLATQIAFLEHGDELDELTRTPLLPDAEAVALARIGLANHFAAAVLMPYPRFLEAAESARYDIDALSVAFGVGFETTCHRMATLQRPGARGVPFLFVRVDQAGNISKRQSAIDFHFSRIGGSCPLWVVHDAFSAPGRIQVQLAEMPDGGRHLWMARTTDSGATAWRGPRKRFAIGLGCDVRHAKRIVYSDGLDLSDAGSFTPIGSGCRVCERPDCAQRAFPTIGRSLVIDERRAGAEPYRHH